MARARAIDDDLMIKTMKKANQPLSAYDLIDILPGDTKPKPPVVYRALERLRAEGRVHRLENLKAFIACDGHTHDHETIFAICVDCQKVEEVEDHGLCGLLSNWQSKTGFKSEQRTFEILGHCADCQSANC